jgi:integrase
MRRTFATLFCEAGGSRDAIEQILGHTSSGNRITARYVLPSLAYLTREMAKLTLQPTTPAKVYAMAEYRAS